MGVHKYNFNNVTISKKVSLRSHFVIKKDGKCFCENTDNNKYCLRSQSYTKILRQMRQQPNRIKIKEYGRRRRCYNGFYFYLCKPP